VSEGQAQGLSRWALWFGGLAFFTCYLGQTVLGVIQPTVVADLGLSEAEGQWVVNVFFLTMALFAAPGGRLGDFYGHREVLLIALLIFAGGSALAAALPGFAGLIAGLAVAGAGASTLYPSSAAMVANRTAAEHRGRALGFYSAIGVAVFSLGPLIAGGLTEAIDWRAVFAFQALAGLALAALGWLRVDNRPAGAPEPFDGRGLGVLMVGLTAVLVALMQALVWGWDAAPTVLLFLAGVAVLGLFAALELRAAHPLLDLDLLRDRALVGIVLAMFAAQFVLNGFLIYAATFFQHVLGYGPLLASVALLPAFLFAPLFNILAGRLTDRIGPRRPAVAGYLLTTAAFAWLAVFAGDGEYWPLLPALLALCVAIAPMFTSLLTGLSNLVAPDERGNANALVLTVRWIGAAAGTMVLGVVVHAEAGAEPTAAAYGAAFAVAAGMALAGALACFVLLRNRG
jgi:MFS family permease